MVKKRGTQSAEVGMYQPGNEILVKIDAFLERRLSGQEVSSWAVTEYVNREFSPNNVLNAAALRLLMMTGFGDLKPDVFDDRLNEIKAAMLGKVDYTIKFRRYPPEELRRRLPESAFASIDQPGP